uniref:Ciliary neurotrophic factor n=1 Tax=Amphiprion percula TaxID=161767 RepID=A0A3P8SP18_AMPPE
VSLARLLHLECTRLLKREGDLLSDHTPEGDALCPCPQTRRHPVAEEQVQCLHSALRQCLRPAPLCHPEGRGRMGRLEGDYETMKKNVRTRRGALTTLEVTPDHQCNEVDGTGGLFGLKMWTYRVLLELIHWADHAAQTLHVLHREREGTEEI